MTGETSCDDSKPGKSNCSGRERSVSASRTKGESTGALRAALIAAVRASFSGPGALPMRERRAERNAAFARTLSPYGFRAWFSTRIDGIPRSGM